VAWPVAGYPEYHTSADNIDAVDPDPRGTPPPPPPRPPNGIGRARAARSSPLLLPPTSEGLLRPLQQPASAAPTHPPRLPLPSSATGPCSPSKPAAVQVTMSTTELLALFNRVLHSSLARQSWLCVLLVSPWACIVR
jgi:hypothetical protein